MRPTVAHLSVRPCDREPLLPRRDRRLHSNTELRHLLDLPADLDVEVVRAGAADTQRPPAENALGDEVAGRDIAQPPVVVEHLHPVVVAAEAHFMQLDEEKAVVAARHPLNSSVPVDVEKESAVAQAAPGGDLMTPPVLAPAAPVAAGEGKGEEGEKN